LLSDAPVDGVFGVTRRLGPYRFAVFVDQGNYQSAIAGIEWACQCWGGAGFLLVPTDVELRHMADEWRRFADGATEFGHSAQLPGELPESAPLGHGADPVSALLATVVLMRSDANRLRVRDTVIASGHDWHAAYLATLGSLPNRPNAEILERSPIRHDIEFGDILDIEREETSEPSVKDMFARLSDRLRWPPTMASLLGLGREPVPSVHIIGEVRSPFPPPPHSTARQVGSRIVVLYEPGLVEDVCLLWNLRAAHAQPRGFPLGIPCSADLKESVMTLLAESRGTGMEYEMGGPPVVTGFSEAARTISEREGYQFIEPWELLRVPPPPFRQSSDVAVVTDGRCVLPAWGTADQTELTTFEHYGRGGLMVHIELQPQPLPHLPSLNNQDLMGFPFRGWRNGGYEHKANEAQELLTVKWPTSWSVLEAAAKQHGLSVRPSPAGYACAALFNLVGGIHGIELLLDRKLVDLLQELTEPSGVGWFREKLRELGSHGELGPDLVDALSKAADDKPDRQVTSSLLKQRVFHDQMISKEWLAWAVQCGLLIRGCMLKCDACGRRSWVQLANITGGNVCSGCGSALESSVPVDQLTFAHRPSELLVQVGRVDGLVHLLALRWVLRLFDESSWGRASAAYGAFPGVEFVREHTGEIVGEADVALLLADGQIVVGECKRRAAGLTADEVRKLETLSDAVRAPWAFAATLDEFAKRNARWEAYEHRLPDRPQFALYGEHLFAPWVQHALAVDPFSLDAAAGGPEITLADRVRWLRGR
jgi:hypothetical protein